jgi:xylose isomerase
MKLATRINSFLPGCDGDVVKVLDAFQDLGLSYAELNYPEHTHGIEASDMKELLGERGLELNGVAVRFRKPFLNGEFGNADPDVAADAVALAKAGCDYCRKAGGKVVTIWLGFDGFDYPFQIDYARVWNQVRDAFRAVCDYAPDLSISIEYKPFEERSFAFIDSFGLVLSMIDDIDRPNIGATLDYCHMLMKHDNPAYGADILGARGKLYGIHLNDGYGRFDDGLMVGTVTLPQTIEFLYYARKHGYANAIYFDTFPKREEAVAECERNMRMVGRIWAAIDRVGMDRIAEIVAENSGVRVSDLVMEAFLAD